MTPDCKSVIVILQEPLAELASTLFLKVTSFSKLALNPERLFVHLSFVETVMSVVPEAVGEV